MNSKLEFRRSLLSIHVTGTLECAPCRRDPPRVKFKADYFAIACIQALSCVRARTLSYANAHTCVHKVGDTHIRHVKTYTYIHVCIHMHTHTLSLTHTHPHAMICHISHETQT